MQTALPAEALTGKQRRKIVLIGHDRGARICHRLAVDNDHPAFEILGTVLMDIVPTIVQFQSFANPQHSVDSFHWPFLAVPSPIPEKMIISTGGAWFVEQMISKWTGINPEGRNRVEEALPLYGSHFEKESVVYASCADYRAGATEDCEEQIKDQEMGRKLAIPTLIIFSKDYLGVRYDMKEVWKQWVSRPDLIRLKGIGNGVGHFLPEEDPRTTTQSVLQWLKEVLDIET